jgi:hypothetical protein
MKVIVKELKGNEIPIDISEDQSVTDLKIQIEKTANIKGKNLSISSRNFISNLISF